MSERKAVLLENELHFPRPIEMDNDPAIIIPQINFDV